MECLIGCFARRKSAADWVADADMLSLNRKQQRLCIVLAGLALGSLGRPRVDISELRSDSRDDEMPKLEKN